jgi:hypothetical protein
VRVPRFMERTMLFGGGPCQWSSELATCFYLRREEVVEAVGCVVGAQDHDLRRNKVSAVFLR